MTWRPRDEMAKGPTSETKVVKTYGAGSFLGLLSPLLAFFMARRGMNGWQQSAIREMEDDAVAMSRNGYRVVSSDEIAMPLLGIIAYRVTYERMDHPG
jgi:hypothetical protein